MPTIKKEKVNRLYIALGLLFGFLLVWPGNEDIQESELYTKTVVVSQDIQRINGRRSKYEYRFHVNEYPCSFVIETAGGMAAHWQNLDDITRNDTLRIKIRNSSSATLNNKSEHIPVYSLVKNHLPVYDTDAFNSSQKKLDKRWNIVYVILSLLLLLRGFAIISGKVAYLLGGLGALIIITLRLLNIWW